MTFHLFNCKITISPLFPGVITLLLLVDTTGMMSRMLLAVMLHECGHLAFMTGFGCLPKAVVFSPFEVNMVAGNRVLTPWQQALVSAGGILSNCVAAAAVSGDLRMINIFLAVFNGLPIFSMDGYQLLELLLGKGSLGLTLLSTVVLGAVGLFGCWLFWKAHNPLLLLFCSYLSVLQIRGQRRS